MEDFGTLDLSSSSSDSETPRVSQNRADKLKQSEESFQVQKREWIPVCQDKNATRRLDTGNGVETVLSREEILDIKVAAEERYYQREYTHSLALANRAAAAAGPANALSNSERQELEAVIAGCNRRLSPNVSKA